MAKKSDLLNHLDRLKKLETERRAADESAYEGCALAEADAKDWPTSAEEFVLVLSRLGRSVDEFTAVVDSIRQFSADAKRHDLSIVERQAAQEEVAKLVADIKKAETDLGAMKQRLSDLNHVGSGVAQEFAAIRRKYRDLPIVRELYFAWQSGNPNA